MLKPLSGTHLQEDERIYNYRISRARRVIENAFGILVARFRIFESIINLLPESVDILILAGVCLHNLIRIRELSENLQEQFYEVPTFESEDRTEAYVPHNGGEMQDLFKTYFMSPQGEVPWQRNASIHEPDEWVAIDMSN